MEIALEPLVQLSGDPNIINDHDEREYCMDITHKRGADQSAKKYIRWYEYIEHQPRADRQFFENILIKKGADLVKTHTCMNGMVGGFHVSVEDEARFLETYCRLWANKNSYMYVVEKPSPIFRLFIDMDFKQPQGIISDAVAALGKAVNQTVSKFYPGKQLRYVICCSNYTKEESLDSQGTRVPVTKTGVHLHWPDLFVNVEQTLNIRESILSDLQHIWGLRKPPMNDWADVIDTSVYSKNGKQGAGLRMLGSCKCNYCPNTVSKKCPKDCILCGGSSKILADGHGRPYMLFMASNGIERDISIEKEYLGSFPKLLNDVIIRSHLSEPSPGYVVPAGAPLYIETQKQSMKKASAQAKKVVYGDKIYQVLQDAIRNINVYSDIIVTQVAQRGATYMVHVSGTNSRFCQNIQREHKNNRIWFLIDHLGIKQRCHDNTDVMSPEMKFGLCSCYESHPAPLCADSMNELFPRDDASRISLVNTTTSHISTGHYLIELAELGDSLSKDLFGSSWSATLLLDKATFVKQSQYVKGLAAAHKYQLIYPHHLGTQYTQAMVSLGFPAPEEEFISDLSYEGNEQDVPIPIKSFLQLEQSLFDELDEVISFLCNNDFNILATCTQELYPIQKGVKRMKLTM